MDRNFKKVLMHACTLSQTSCKSLLSCQLFVKLPFLNSFNSNFNGDYVLTGSRQTSSAGNKLTVPQAKKYVRQYLKLSEAEVHLQAINLVSMFRTSASDTAIHTYLKEKAKAAPSEKGEEEKENVSASKVASSDHQKPGLVPLMQDKMVDKAFTFEEAAHKIKSLLKWTDPNAINLAAQYLVLKQENFKTLDDPFTTSFLTNSLPQLMPHIQRLIAAAAMLTSVQTVDAMTHNTAKTLTFSSPVSLSVRHKELKKIAKFKEFTQIAEANNSRYNQFVFLLGEPKLPTRHSGVDDACHPELEISFIWLDLLQRGFTTLNFIHHSANSKKPCPKVLFMRPPIKMNEDSLTKEIHTGHTLDAYGCHIENENQLPIEFHVAGHGSNEFIGPMVLERRMTAEDFADYFCMIASSSNLFEMLKAKKLVFVFHTCNSAYAEITSTKEEEIKAIIKSQSIIGKFYQAMVKLGFQNIEVSGFRGFYSTYTNGAGARVTGSLDDKNAKTYSAEQAKFIIAKKDGNEFVILPKGEGLNFPVRFEGVLFRP